MERIKKSIDVNVPLHAAYNQWTQFEDFPKFMKGVNSVHGGVCVSRHLSGIVKGLTQVMALAGAACAVARDSVSAICCSVCSSISMSLM